MTSTELQRLRADVDRIRAARDELSDELRSAESKLQKYIDSTLPRIDDIVRATKEMLDTKFPECYITFEAIETYDSVIIRFTFR